MLPERNYVMSIAGLDPSGGAGLLADIKTFEQHKVYGLSVSTASTIQTENEFYSVQWEELQDVLKAVTILLDTYPVKVVKTGIVPSFDFLLQLVSYIKKTNSEIKIIVDPIIKSSTNFDFQNKISKKELIKVLANIFLITPNLQEAMLLTNSSNAEDAAKELSGHCNVLLKGGHNKNAVGLDHLYIEGKCISLEPVLKGLSEKHGSGCVLSAAIASHLANGSDLEISCIRAKRYIEQFLSSTNSLLGFHHV